MFGLSWSFLKNKTNFKNLLVILIIGPYILTSFLLGSGLFTDRSRELRETMEHISSLEIVKNQNIKVDKSGINETNTHSKIIKISILTPNLGRGFNNINDLNSGELAWSTNALNNDINNDNSYEIIYKNDTLEPWRLILRR